MSRQERAAPAVVIALVTATFCPPFTYAEQSTRTIPAESTTTRPAAPAPLQVALRAGWWRTTSVTSARFDVNRTYRLEPAGSSSPGRSWSRAGKALTLALLLDHPQPSGGETPPSGAPASAAAMPPPELADLLEHLDLPQGTPIPLAIGGALPEPSPLEVAIDCGVDAHVRSLLGQCISNWNRSDFGRDRPVRITPEFERGTVVLVRWVERDDIETSLQRGIGAGLGDPRCLPPLAPPACRSTWFLGGVPVEIGTRSAVRDSAPVRAYVLLRAADGYEVVWRLAARVEVQEKTEGEDVWSAFRSLLLARRRQ